MSDSAGFATFTIIRAGTLGTVNVQWRIDSEAQNDFVPPITGLIQFPSVISLEICVFSYNRVTCSKNYSL